METLHESSNAELINEAIRSTCTELSLYCRDVNLPHEFAYKYESGMIIRERGFVDATALCGGMVTAYRYLIVSNHMVPMQMFEGDKNWKLHIANQNSRFMVLEKLEHLEKRTIILLHLHNDNWQVFKSLGTEFAKDLVYTCSRYFIKQVESDPIPSVSTNEWLARCQFPIGMSDDGAFFPIDD